MTSLTVAAATAAEEAAVVDALMLAFAGDPATRWTWPEPSAFLAAFARFARAFGGAAFVHGSTFRLGTAGTALWLPPGIGPDDRAMIALMQATAAPESMIDGMQVMQQMAGYHPHEPHWYLPLIGVDPAWQDRGVGGRLMKHATDLFDRDGAVAYLESSNPSVSRRTGFSRSVLGSYRL